MRIKTLLDSARQIASVLGGGSYVDDWERRALLISATGDYLSLRARDDAFVSEEMEERDVAPETDSGVRTAAAEALEAVWAAPERIRLPSSAPAVGDDARIMQQLCGTLDYSEKIALTATAHALASHAMPLELFGVIGNILFEEAYHLRVVTDVLALNQRERPWLPEDKATNLELVRRCGDAYSYMLVEHALFEGRGGLAAARGVYEARVAGVSETITQLFVKICKQETNHALLGFIWMDLLRQGSELPEDIKPVIREFIERECADSSGTFRTLRQRYSCWMLWRYLGGAPIGEITADIKQHSRECMATGSAAVSAVEIMNATDRLHQSL